MKQLHVIDQSSSTLRQRAPSGQKVKQTLVQKIRKFVVDEDIDEKDTEKNDSRINNNYEIEDAFKVASFDPKLVEGEELGIFRQSKVKNKKLLLAAFRMKTFRSAIIGVSWRPVLPFLALYYILQVLYHHNVFEKICEAEHATKHYKEICEKQWPDWVEVMQKHESTATKYLTFILGFYVGQMIKRWWDQVKSLPEIEPIVNCMAGFVQMEFDENDFQAKAAALELRKKIVRYSLLSWTMCLSIISTPLGNKFLNPQDYVKKGLITDKELQVLQGKSLKSWKDQWWIPITWAISLVNSNHAESQGCKLKEQKGVIYFLSKFQYQLHIVRLYQNNPIPIIYGQAVMFAIYSWILLGVFASQGGVSSSRNIDREDGYGLIGIAFFFSIPWYQIVKIILMYAWLKVANIVRNPFGLDKDYDINLEEMLDQNIWKASVAIKHMDSPVYSR